jgi:hypothetical protein
MKKRILSTFLLLLAACYLTTAQTPDTPRANTADPQKTESDNSEYHQLVERVKHGDMKVDFIRLRDVFAQRLCDDKVKTESPDRAAFVAAFEAKEYAKAVELVEGVLDYEFVHLGLHRAAEDAYRQLNNQTKADFHKAVADKLLNALLTSGDGKTAETAYRVLTIREEYFIMNQLGYKVSMQALIVEKDKAYDLLSGRDAKTDKEVSLYFDISSFFGGCKRVTSRQ